MNRPQQTSFDFVVAAISPALIIALIGSLVFFLTAVFYGGDYEKRLLFILAMFVMATVLIARLAITEGAGYASMFGIFLAIVSGLAMMRFVEVRGSLAGLSWAFNFFLLALIWWCAHRLTINCTLIDDSEDASGQGLLQSFGWDKADDDNKPMADNRSPAQPPAVDEASTAAAVTAPANAPPKRSKWNRQQAAQTTPAGATW